MNVMEVSSENDGAASSSGSVAAEPKMTGVQCPTYPGVKCSVAVPTAGLLSHIIWHHSQVNTKNQYPVEFQEIFHSNKGFTSLRSGIIKFGAKVVVSAFMYGGIKGDTKSLPVFRGLCEGNVELPENWQKYHTHLPIFLMACRTSICEHSRIIQESDDTRDLKKDVYVMWLAAVPTKQPMFGQLIAFSGNFMRCDARVLRIRDITANQDPATILAEHKQQNYLILNHSEMRALTYFGTKKIWFRIGISENEKELLDEGRVSMTDVKFPDMEI